MLVYGRNVAKDLLKKGKKIEKIYLQDNFSDKEVISLIENQKIKVKRLQKREIDNLCSGVHQGILLFVPDYEYTDFWYKEKLRQQKSRTLLQRTGN